MTAKDFAKMKHVEFKKHLAISRDGVDGSTPLACRRGLLPKTMGSGRSQTKVDRSKCKTGAEMRRGRPARPPSDTFEWCGVKFKVKRPPVEGSSFLKSWLSGAQLTLTTPPPQPTTTGIRDNRGAIIYYYYYHYYYYYSYY